MSQTFGPCHPDAEALAAFFRDRVQAGEVATYEKTATAVLDVRTPKGRARLNTAKRILLRDHSIALTAERGVGIRRLPENEKATAARSHLGRARNSARRGLKILGSADPAGFGPQERLVFNSTAAQLAMVDRVANNDATKRIQAASAATEQRLTLEKTILALMSNGK